MNIIFPFVKDKATFRPEIPIGISDPSTGKICIYNGVVDSGADVTVIPSVIFEVLGIDYKKDAFNITKIYGVSGQAQNAWELYLDIIILKENSDIPFKRVENVKVCCIESVNSMVLLGTNFFSPKFKVTLDYSNNFLLLEC